MGMLSLDIPHSLAPEEAKKRVEALFKYWGDKYGVKSSWAGDVATYAGKVMGVSIEGKLTVHPKKVGGEATDPGFLLRGQAKKYLERKFGDYLNPNKKLEDLAKSED
ncbi:MAG: polyhydroxyalkanoic acid system family protein [Myxococcaceae bacterium]